MNKLIKILIATCTLLAIGVAISPTPVLADYQVYTYNDGLTHQVQADTTTYYPCGACPFIFDDKQDIMYNTADPHEHQFYVTGTFPDIIYDTTLTVTFGSLPDYQPLGVLYVDEFSILLIGDKHWVSGGTLIIIASDPSYPGGIIFRIEIKNAVVVYYTPTLTSVSSNQVPTAGATITFTGTNFGGSATVDIATVGISTCSLISSTQVNCAIPANAALGPVTMTLKIGGKDPRPSIITDLPSIMTWADPVVNAITFRGVPTTGGSLTITGANLGPSSSSMVVSIDTIGIVGCTMPVTGATLVCALPAHIATSPLAITVNVTIASVTSSNTFTNAIMWYVPPAVTTPSNFLLPVMIQGLLVFDGVNLGNVISDIVVSIDTIGVLLCYISNPNVQFSCITPIHAPTSPLTITITITKLNNPINFTYPGGVRWSFPTIASASPSTVSVAGSQITFTGQCLGNLVSFYTGVSATSTTGTVVSVSNTQIVVNMGARSVATGSGSAIPIVLSWSGSSLLTGNILTFVTPILYSVSSSVSHSGGTIIVSGNFFGTDKSYYDGVYVMDSGTQKMAGVIQTMSNTVMTVLMNSFVGPYTLFYQYDLLLKWRSSTGSYPLPSCITIN